MREIVIVIRDLYLEPELVTRPRTAAQRSDPASSPASTAAAAGQGGNPAGLELVARFGVKTTLPRGWRAWLAQWLSLPQYADAAPASVAAAALDVLPADRASWLATPLHLIAGLTSVHFDRRSLLRLASAELTALADSFRDTFRGSGFELHPLAGGELLLSGPAVAGSMSTTEPARMPLLAVADALPAGEGASALRRLGAEIEMWLHGHPVNEARVRRGAAAVATLWLWGGGAPACMPASPAREVTDAAYGADAYLRGLWRLAGAEPLPMPVDWRSVLREPHAQRAVAVVEVAELLQDNTAWCLADAVAEIDRRLIAPSLAALRHGELDRLVLLANDRSLALRAPDRWRLWRRRRAGLEGLA